MHTSGADRPTASAIRWYGTIAAASSGNVATVSTIGMTGRAGVSGVTAESVLSAPLILFRKRGNSRRIVVLHAIALNVAEGAGKFSTNDGPANGGIGHGHGHGHEMRGCFSGQS
jgi:hypothetical protein